jgi:hypothetical protein
MKNNILTLFSLAILFIAVSCSSTPTDSATILIANELQESSTRSAPAANQEEEFNLLLARKWQNESSAIFLDLKIDGSFEGKFDMDNVIVGLWSVSEDQKTLSLKEGGASDGKGGNLNVSYTILDMSTNDMKVMDQDGTELEFVAN